MNRIPHVPFSVVLGVLLLVSGAGIYGYGWYEDATTDCADGVSFEPAEQPSSTDATNFSALTHDQQGVFLLGLDEDGVGGVSTTDDEIIAIAHSLPFPINYDGTTYTRLGDSGDCFIGDSARMYGTFTMLASVLMFVIGGVLQVVFRRW